MSWQRRATELFSRLTDVVRRFTPTDTSDPKRWDVLGFADDTDEERDSLELFSGVGFVSRPPAATNSECIAVAVNARDHHVVVATRDADTVQAVVEEVGLAADETLVYTSNTIIKILADGTVEIRGLSGTAVALATKSDVERLRDQFVGHVHPTAGTGAPSPAARPESPTTPIEDIAVDGTTVLKGE